MLVSQVLLENGTPFLISALGSGGDRSHVAPSIPFSVGPGSTEFQGCLFQIIDRKCLLLRGLWQDYSIPLGFWMKFLWGHWKEGAARYLVVSGLVRAEATWDLGRCLACGRVLQLRLTDHVGTAGVGQGYLPRSDPAGERWTVLASLPAGGPSCGEEPLSGPLTNRPVAMVLGPDLMTPRPGLLHQEMGSLGPGYLPGQWCRRATVDGFLLLHSCYQSEGVHLSAHRKAQ